MYTDSLLTMGDDEFFSGLDAPVHGNAPRNSLTLDEITLLSSSFGEKVRSVLRMVSSWVSTSNGKSCDERSPGDLTGLTIDLCTYAEAMARVRTTRRNGLGTCVRGREAHL
jgi:hypothetical protein